MPNMLKINFHILKNMKIQNKFFIMQRILSSAFLFLLKLVYLYIFMAKILAG